MRRESAAVRRAQMRSASSKGATRCRSSRSHEQRAVPLRGGVDPRQLLADCELSYVAVEHFAVIRLLICSV